MDKVEQLIMEKTSDTFEELIEELRRTCYLVGFKDGRELPTTMSPEAAFILYKEKAEKALDVFER